ncbi:timeless-domain-containing protein [Gonapodya prolifera JEL478]|uniref:Timeless-domain-containing protein n=1 Tax=Gonapodya prolifera (strain JEL478) TaxID=1344416 RepID=A0A139AFZ0_GONPJ|nr:timeless-domain-containing protein [Gonapodya prolifera JEL478]|eukprot:KXS15619.1 timeless-domain-containing protein [Gonapodya prolifera JEL478]
MLADSDEEPSLAEQRQSADDFYLLNAATSLGGWESRVGRDGRTTQKIYVPGVECIGCLRDLKRYLRRDDKSKTKHVLRQLGSWRIVQKDLLPILVQFSDDQKLSSAVVELLVPMTWPIDLESDDIPGQHDVLLSYKEAFCREGPLRAVFKVLVKTLAVPPRTRIDRDHSLIRMCLTLFLNLLLIKDPAPAPSASAEEYIRSTLQEELVCRLKEDKILDFMVTLASSADEREYEDWNMMVAEIIYNILLGWGVSEVLDASSRTRRIAEALQKEQQRKRQQAALHPIRHSRFGGSFTFRMDDGHAVNVFNSDLAFARIDDALDKGKKKRARREEKGEDEHHQRRAIASERTRGVLKEFAESLLESSFNVLLHSMKRDFDRESAKVRKDDRARYLWLASFFLEFQRETYRKVLANFVPPPKPTTAPPGPENTDTNPEEQMVEPPAEFNYDSVATIVDLRTLSFIVRQVRQYNDDKEWGMLHIALDCFKEILKTLEDMAACDFDEFKEVSQNLQHNLYYEAATLELVDQLLRSFKPIRHKRSYLLSLVETTHVFLRMLERFSQAKGVLFMRRKKKKTTKRREAIKKPTADGVMQADEATKGAEDENQGTGDESQIPDGAASVSGANAEVALERKASVDVGPDIGDLDEDSDSDQENSTNQYVEHEFHFEKLEVKFASQAVIDTYCYLLQDYTRLTPDQLHMITKMFHRVAVRRRYSGLFFHVSNLALFNKILLDRKSLPADRAGKELVECLTFCVKKFFKAAAMNPWLLWDAFFAKSKSDCRVLEFGEDELARMEQEKIRERIECGSDEEIEIKPGLLWSQEVGVAVGLLVESNQRPLVEWLIETLERVSKSRSVSSGGVPVTSTGDWDLGALLSGQVGGGAEPTDDAQGGEAPGAAAKHYVIVGETEPRKEALVRNKAFRLLLSLLKLMEWPPLEGKVDDATTPIERHWIVPSYLDATELLEYRGMLTSFLEVPLDINGKPASKMLRKKKKHKRRSRDPSEKKERSKKKKESKSSHLSAQIVVEDGSDSYLDEEFFRREAELREKIGTSFSVKAAEAQMEAAKRELEKMEKRKDEAKKRKEAKAVAKKGQNDGDASDTIPTESKPAQRRRQGKLLPDSSDESGNDSDSSRSSGSSASSSSDSSDEDAPTAATSEEQHPSWDMVRRGVVSSSGDANRKFSHTDDDEDAQDVTHTSSVKPRQRLRPEGSAQADVLELSEPSPEPVEIRDTVMDGDHEVEARTDGAPKRRRLLVEDSDED